MFSSGSALQTHVGSQLILFTSASQGKRKPREKQREVRRRPICYVSILGQAVEVKNDPLTEMACQRGELP